MKDSRISGFYRMTVDERIDALLERRWLDAETAASLKDSTTLMHRSSADRMIENVIGVFGLPLAVAPNFTVNGRDYVVPMVVEEPSIVAGVSGAARLARAAGGFTADAKASLAIGQILLAGAGEPDAAIRRLEDAKGELVALANSLQPNLEARGGGARDIEFFRVGLPGARSAAEETIVLHLLVDTCDAMGANLVNSMCEGIAPRIEALSGAGAMLRILSNLADRSLVTARATILLDDLRAEGRSGEAVRDAIVLATRFANADPHRAATHNKGIMNGIDALAIATGNDWRSIEAAAHAWAARDGAYRSLTSWSVDTAGNLAGELTMPIKVGTVGGSLQSNPAVPVSLRIAGIRSAAELAQLMAAVGLAQNFAALRALVTVGIQEGHMRLHARSVAASADAPPELFERVVEGLIESGEIKIRKAKELLTRLDDEAGGDRPVGEIEAHGAAAGKVILLGEHAAVYDRHVLALPLHRAVTVSLRESGETSWIFRGADEERRFAPGAPVPAGFAEMLEFIVERLGIGGRKFGRKFEIRLQSQIPTAAGLGSSAAVAVALLRAFDHVFALRLGDDAINELALDCERLAHGDPSGIDNTVATFGQAVLYRKSGTPPAKALDLAEPPPIVIACGPSQSSTKQQVMAVRARHATMTSHYDAIFDEIDALSIAGATALAGRDYAELGALMNVCHGLLNAIGVSTPELERMVHIARRSGAVGAKLTGAGGGGSIVALCPGTTDGVRQALGKAGYHIVRLGAG